MKLSFWGSSLVSAYWNGAATYYRGTLRALAGLGFDITFYEPDAYDRQSHRDIADPDWARVVVYDPADHEQLSRYLAASQAGDIVVKASGVGVLDELLESAVAAMPDSVSKVFWDVDAPATLQRMTNPVDPFRRALPQYDLVLTYGGGDRVVNEYRSLGAQDCVPIYNAFDADTHHPAPPDPRFTCDLSFQGNRLPDREARVDDFFFAAAAQNPSSQFLLGGNGWADKPMPGNVRYAGHVYTADHNAFNCSSKAVLNISRDSMAEYGFSPATRVFEAAGAGSCLITDAWVGIDYFLRPDEEILIANNGREVAQIVRDLSPERAKIIGDAARKRVLAEHTYEKRSLLISDVLQRTVASKQHTAAVAQVGALR